MASIKTSAAGRKAIAQREGNKLKAYPDPATGGEPWTIGVGHTSAAGPPNVKKGMVITAAQSDEILSRDLKLFENAVSKAVKVPLTQNEFDALVSLAFNIGGGAFSKSTLVKKLNNGDRKGAADAFLSWNKADGRTLKGLTTRRQAERKQFLSNGEPSSSVKDKGLRRGDKGPYVAELKTNLAVLGFGPLTPDDVFDDKTKESVERFQRKTDGLVVDGIAGPRTIEAIGKALNAKETAPKLQEAEKTVPPSAPKEVKKQTGLWGWIVSIFTLGSGGFSKLLGAEWPTVLAVFGGGALLLLVILLMRRQIIAAFKEINAELQS